MRLHPVRGRTTVAGGLATLLASAALVAVPAGLPAFAETSATEPDFGPNVMIFDPSMSAEEINASLLSISGETEESEGRHAVFFKPGTYGDGSNTDPATATGVINGEVGYYTSVAGLGSSPEDVVLNGALHVEAVQVNAETPWTAPAPGSLNNFWRSMSNLAINPIQQPAGADAERQFPEGIADPNTLRWAVSQAAPLRRLDVRGDLSLFGRFGEYASGGYVADTRVAGKTINGSQQQYFTQNSTLGSWEGAVWNQVFSGVEGAPAASYPENGYNPDNAVLPYTVMPTTRQSRSAPFLTIDDEGSYSVFAPAAKTNSSGADWGTSEADGRSIPLSDFYLAHPGDSAATINAALAAGKNLLVTPGIYGLDAPLEVTEADTVVLGIGLATLVPTAGTAAIETADVTGIQLSGITVDAGETISSVLVQVGPRGASALDAADPVTLTDVFVRVGGPRPGKAGVGIEVNSPQALLDGLWIWRADHGAGVGWDDNPAETGLIVNSDNVTALGLAVEHFQKNQVIWNGNGGQTVFYQSELPYDPPSQEAWMDGDDNGYASYRVADDVTTHEAFGLGVYSFFPDTVAVATQGIQAPERAGVTFTHAMTRFLNGNGGITSVINGVGEPVSSTEGQQNYYVAQYPETVATPLTVTLTPSKTEPDGAEGWYRGVTATAVASDPAAVLTAQLDDGEFAPLDGPYAVPDGEHTVTVIATDAEGNTSEPVTWTGKVDATAPTAAASVKGSTVTLTADDATSGIASIEYSLGGAWIAYTKPVQVAAGTTSVAYRATDVAGNVSAEASVAVSTKAASVSVSKRVLFPGTKLTVSGRDLPAGEYDVVLRPGGAKLGTVTAGDDGRFSSRVTVPRSIPTAFGAVQLVSSDGTVVAKTWVLTIGWSFRW